MVPPVVKSSLEEKKAAAVSFISAVNSNSPAGSVLVIYANPLRFELFQDGVLQIVVNERSLLHYEKTQVLGEKKKAAVGQSDAERHGGKEVTDYGEDGKKSFESTEIQAFAEIGIRLAFLKCPISHYFCYSIYKMVYSYEIRRSNSTSRRR